MYEVEYSPPPTWGRELNQRVWRREKNQKIENKKKEDLALLVVPKVKFDY